MSTATIDRLLAPVMMEGVRKNALDNDILVIDQRKDAEWLEGSRLGMESGTTGDLAGHQSTEQAQPLAF
jgi:hypothetical protein